MGHIIYLFTYWRAPWSFPSFGNYGYSCYKCVCMFSLGHVFNTFWQIPRIVSARSYGQSVFSFVRKRQTLLTSGCTTLPAHQPWMGAPPAPQAHQRVLLSEFWVWAISGRICVWALHSIPLICLSALSPPTRKCLVCERLSWILKSGSTSSPTLFFFYIEFSILGLLPLHPNFGISLSISAKSLAQVFVEIALNPQTKLGRTDILTIPGLPVPEHGLSFCFFSS